VRTTADPLQALTFHAVATWPRDLGGSLRQLGCCQHGAGSHKTASVYILACMCDSCFRRRSARMPVSLSVIGLAPGGLLSQAAMLV
jgi:hypothetical protein